MIRSVSTLGRSIGAATAESVVKASMGSRSFLSKRTDIREVSGDRGRCGHRRTHEVRTDPLSLTPLEVAIRRGGDALAGSARVAVDANAHGAPRLAPLEAGLAEHAIE